MNINMNTTQQQQLITHHYTTLNNNIQQQQQLHHQPMIKSDPKDLVVRKKVVRVAFGLYSDDDVRARSVVEITSPQTFSSDNDGTTPLPGGLYDAKLGPFAAHDPLPCPTCAGRFLTCGGHFGHVELCVPLYQPLLMGELLRVLACKCLCCHKLRVPTRALKVAHAKLLLLHHGRWLDYHALDGTLAQAIRRSLEHPNEPTSSTSRKTPQAAAAMEAVLHEIMDELQDKPLPSSNHTTVSTYQLELIREYTKTLLQAWKSEVKCQHCGAISPKVKQDQHNKIFQKGLTAKQQRLNAADNLECTSALETLQARHKGNKTARTTTTTAATQPGRGDPGYQSDDSDDTEQPDRHSRSSRHPMMDDEAMEDNNNNNNNDNEEDSDVAQAEEEEQDDEDDDSEEDDGLASPIKKTRKAAPSKTTVTNATTQASTDQYYMHPGEVRAQCQLTWEHHGALLTLVLFGLPSTTSTTTSRRRRRPQDSYQVFFVQAIAVPPSRFRPPMTTGGMTVEHGQNQYLAKVLTEHAGVRQELFAPNGNERLAHTLWIQLQTSYNCFLDSSKDPSVAAQLGQTPNGIRQLLEKKEGIFRKHMMGKRVDSACRSVISPDPYVGTNEIGIPLAFAHVLTYPTPVTEWNMTELRRLVERGPANYPGARWVEVRGQRIDLSKMTQARRRAVGAMLLKESAANRSSHGKPVIVGRQLRHGDTMLVNRQVRFFLYVTLFSVLECMGVFVLY